MTKSLTHDKLNAMEISASVRLAMFPRKSYTDAISSGVGGHGAGRTVPEG